MTIKVVVIFIWVIFLLIYSAWFAFFTKYAIEAQKRLPWGVRLPILVHPLYTKLASTIAFIFFATCLALLIHAVLIGAPWERPSP